MDRIVLFSLQPNVQHKVKVHDLFLVIMTSVSEPYVRCQNMKMEQQQTQREAFSWLVAVKWAESIQDLKNCRALKLKGKRVVL